MNKAIKSTLFFVTILFCVTNVSAKSEIYTTFFGSKAASGYDVVAYFTESKPVEGKSQFKTEYKDATWLFSSQENLDLFVANPEAYAPQYGGYCAYAVAHDTTASTEPEQWTIRDEKLYLNYNADVQKKWLDSPDKFIALGDENWPGVLK